MRQWSAWMLALACAYGYAFHDTQERDAFATANLGITRHSERSEESHGRDARATKDEESHGRDARATKDVQALQASSLLTLEQAIQIALENNPTLRISERSLQKTKNGVREARSAGNFQIQGSATYTRFDRVAKAQFGPQTIRLGNIENRTARISLNQPIDISGIIRNAVRTAQLGESIADLELQRTRNDLILQVVEAYQGVARAEEFVRVAEEALRNAEERLRLIRAQVDAGVASQFDLLRAETQVAQNQQALLNARNLVQLAQARLNSVLGRDLETPVQVAIPDRLPDFEGTLEALTAQAFAQRPEVRAAKRGIELARANIQNARRGALPSLVLSGQWDFNLNTSTFNPRRETFTAVAVLSVPIWDGGITQARVAQARNDVEIAELRLQQAKDLVALEVRNAYLTLLDARERLAVARKGLEQATEALRLARVRFEAGVSPQLEISDAELAFTQARTNLVNTQYDYLNAYAALLKAVGTIDTHYRRLTAHNSLSMEALTPNPSPSGRGATVVHPPSPTGRGRAGVGEGLPNPTEGGSL